VRTPALRGYEDTPLRDGEIRVRTQFGAPKHGTELHMYRGDSAFADSHWDAEQRIFVPGGAPSGGFPRPLGNIAVGLVTEVGAGVQGVQVGDRVIWNPPTRRMGDLAYGKAMDDRVLLAIMDRLLDVLDRQRLAYDVTFASTVQEETGLIGAESVPGDVECDLALALDVGLVGDVPGVDQRDAAARLGDGPMIVHKDFISYHRPLIRALTNAAQAARIPVQHAVFSVFGSDAGAFIRRGVPAALVAVPTRYTHSPFEMVHLHDVEATVQLLKAFLSRK